MTTTDSRPGAAVQGTVPSGLGHPSRSRSLRDQVARVVMWLAFLLAVIPLVWIL